MNEKIKKLMVEAGYAAPDIAVRAQELANLVLQECCQHLTNIGQDDSREQLEKHFEIKQ